MMCRVGLEPSMLYVLMAALHHCLLYTAVNERLALQTCENKLYDPQDTAFKCHFDLCNTTKLRISMPKMQTDGQTAFQLYIPNSR